MITTSECFFFFFLKRMIDLLVLYIISHYELVYIPVGISQTAPAELVGMFQMTCMT
jgi:hypothetical protein